MERRGSDTDQVALDCGVKWQRARLGHCQDRETLPIVGAEHGIHSMRNGEDLESWHALEGVNSPYLRGPHGSACSSFESSLARETAKRLNKAE